ncbi:MAG: extensin family protein [Alphaproteobacteria bacterium]|nr:extensin family protein [Alphaproteobacteria bacterium]
MKILDQNPQACVTALHQAKVTASLLPNSGRGPACYLDNTVMLNRVSVAQFRPEQTRCNVAARLYLWERHVVQPLARKYFGMNVKEITHFGSYNCRTIRGSDNMSEHATANAFDISGFRLANGRMVSVLKRFKTGGTDGRFLRSVRDGLCDYFNLTLSPDYNADHADHFHVDMGWVRGCH